MGLVCLDFFFLFNVNSFCINTIYHMPFYYFSNATFVPKMLMLCICLWIVVFVGFFKSFEMIAAT